MARLRILLILAAFLPVSLAVAGNLGKNGMDEMTGEELAAQLSGKWIITEVADAEIPYGAIPTLVFDPEGLGGFAGCNRFGVEASYGENGAVEFGDAELTEKVCGVAAMNLESQIVNALQLIDGVRFDEGTRIALTASGDAMIRAERPKED